MNAATVVAVTARPASLPAAVAPTLPCRLDDCRAGTVASWSSSPSAHAVRARRHARSPGGSSTGRLPDCGEGSHRPRGGRPRGFSVPRRRRRRSDPRPRDERDHAEHGSQPRPQEREIAEPRIRHRRHGLPPESLAETGATGRRALEPEPDQGDDRECGGSRREDPEQPASHRCRGVPERKRQRRHASDAEEQQREVQEPAAEVERRDHERRVLEHLSGDSARLRSRRLDVEDPGPVDRVRVSRDDAPGDRVGPPLEPPVDRDRRLLEAADA